MLFRCLLTIVEASQETSLKVTAVLSDKDNVRRFGYAPMVVRNGWKPRHISGNTS